MKKKLYQLFREERPIKRDNTHKLLEESLDREKIQELAKFYWNLKHPFDYEVTYYIKEVEVDETNS